MALEFAHGAIRWLAASAVNTTYAVTGLAFQPKALRFYWIGLDSAGTDVASEAVNSRRGVGFAVSTSSRRSVGSFAQDTAGTSNCGTVASDDCVVCTTDGAGARDGLLDISAIASDGFTLIVDDQGVADITVFWEAWGGSDITVAAVGDIAEPAATGNQDYTVTGFVSGATDQVVMLAGVQSVAAVNTAEAEASGMFIGFAASATAADNICVSGNSDDASTAMDTDGHCISDECLGMIAKAGAATVATRAVLTQFGTDNFRLNWAARAVTNRRSIFLAIKGGCWQSGSLTIAGNSLNNTSAISNTIFTPIGVCLIGRMTAEQATNVSTVNDRIGIGTGTSTSSRRSMGMLDEDATGSSACEINTTIQYDQVLCYPSTAGALLTAYDISSMDTSGFTLINDLAGGVASEWIGYLTFGNPVAKTASDSLATRLTESATAGELFLIEKTASESVSTGLTETATVKALLSLSDSLAVQISETDIAAFEYNLIESLPINLTEVATLDTGAAIEKTASESLLVGLTEDAVLYVRQDASESLSVGLMESAASAVTLATSDDLVNGLTESATQTVSQFVNDSLPIGLTEQVAQQISASTDDSLPVGLTENAAVAVMLSALDDVGVGLTESASVDTGVATQVSASDTLGLSITESALVTAVNATASDSLAVQLTEQATVDTGSAFAQAASDSLIVGLTESALISPVNATATDTLGLSITESALVTAVNATAEDSLAVQVTESVLIVVTASASDLLAVQLTEQTTIDAGTITQTASDSLAVQLTESALVSPVNATATDVITVQVTEAALTLSTESVSDSLAIQFTEQATVEDLTTGFSTKTASDTLPIELTEQPSGYSTGSGNDAIFGLQESAVVLVYTATTDSIRVGLQDASRAVSVTLQAADTLPLGYAEAVLQHVFAIAGDTLPIGVTDGTLPFVLVTGSDSLPAVLSEALLIFNQFTAQDSLAVILTETSSAFDAGDIVYKTGAENVSISLTESGVLFTRTAGTLSPLVATAEYIGIDRRAVDSIGLPKTASQVDGTLPHDVEVIATV